MCSLRLQLTTLSELTRPLIKLVSLLPMKEGPQVIRRPRCAGLVDPGASSSREYLEQHLGRTQ